jgi:hypothetical protein
MRPDSYKPAHDCCFICMHNQPCPGSFGIPIPDMTLCSKHDYPMRFPMQVVYSCDDFEEAKLP